MPIKEHEPGHPLPGGGVRCVHCGAPMGTRYTYTCLERHGVGKTPRARARSALEDNDAISTRLGELRKEQEAGWNTPAATATVAADDEVDWMCG